MTSAGSAALNSASQGASSSRSSGALRGVEDRAFVIQQAAQIRQGFGPARANAPVFVAALREYAAY